MKQLLLVILLTGLVCVTKAQYPTPYQNLGGLNIAVNNNGGQFVGGVFVPPKFADTTVANSTTYANKYPGALIFTTSTNTYWGRNSTGTAWVAVGTGSGGSGWSLTGNSGNSFPTNFLGNTDNVPLQFRVNNTQSGLINGSNGNTYFGYSAGSASSQSTATNNTLLGYRAGVTFATGTNNIIIGANTDVVSSTTSNELNIGNTVYGNLSTGKIGINITTPTAAFHLRQIAISSTSGASGINADNVLTVLGANGGSTSNSGVSAMGGSGSDIEMTAGNGGSITSSPTSGVGGDGGSASLTAGDGGVGTTLGGAGGNINLTAGAGGIGTTSQGTGGYAFLTGGAGSSIGNSSGGNVYISGGLHNGSGTDGNIYLGASPGVGKVSIGSATAPTEMLTVTGNVRFSGALMPNNTAGSSGQVLTSAGAGAVPTWSTITGTGTVTSVGVSGGTTGFSYSSSPVTTSGTMTMSGTLIAANGGTGFASYTVGQLLYANTTTTLARLNITASEGYVLGNNGSIPEWKNLDLRYPQFDYLAANAWETILNTGLVDGTNNKFGTTDNIDMAFYRNSIELARFNSSGFKIGKTGTTSGLLQIGGSTSGTITAQPQAAAGTYNWNWPTTAGTAGQVLTSQGGSSTAMTWTMLTTGTVTSVTATDANGFDFTVTNTTTTPVISLTTTVADTRVIYSSGGAVAGAAGMSFDGTSALTLGVAGTSAGRLLIKGSTSGTITLQGAAAAGTYTFTLPTTGGTNGYSIITNGSGTLSYADRTYTASNGLTMTSNNTVLGGLLTGNTTITTSGFGLTIQGDDGSITPFIVSNANTAASFQGILIGASVSASSGTPTAALSTTIIPTSNSTNTKSLLIASTPTSAGSLATNGFATSIDFQLQSVGYANATTGRIQNTITDSTRTAVKTKLEFGTRTNGSIATVFELANTGQAKLNNYTSSSSFAGTPVGTLQFDASGNIITGSATLGAVTSITTTDYNLLVSPTTGAAVVTTNKAEQTLTDGATITMAASAGFNGGVTIAGNRTLDITGAQQGSTYTVRVTQDGTGSRTLTLPGGGSATLTTTAGATTILSGYYVASTWFWTSSAATSSGGITIGSTTITSGTNTKVLYNNSGVVGEYTISGSGNVAMTISPTFVTPTLGVATATSINKVTITAPATSSTLTVADGSSLITSGAFALTLTSSATSNATIPAGTNTLYSTKSGSITSSQLATSLTDETGTGVAVFGTSPDFTTAITLGGVAVPTISSTNTLTNKRWTARVGNTASSATPTINTDNTDVYKLTAQAAAISSFTTNLSGTPVDGDILEIQITDDGTARAITWGASFVSSTVTLPTTTTVSTTLTVILQYYTTSSYGNNKWTCVNYY